MIFPVAAGHQLALAQAQSLALALALDGHAGPGTQGPGTSVTAAASAAVVACVVSAQVSNVAWTSTTHFKVIYDSVTRPRLAI